MEKPTVRYHKNSLVFMGLNNSAYLLPIDHPSERVSNTCAVQTSNVISFDEATGRLETQNTVYIPEA